MTDSKLKPALEKLARQGWKVSGKAISKTYTFKSFLDAMAFMARLARPINKLDHHPEWTNVYNKVTVNLSTHSARAVTIKDAELAGIMDKYAAAYMAKG